MNSWGTVLDLFSSTPDRLKPLVAGSIGPYGVSLADMSEYTGAYVDNMSTQVHVLVKLW